MQLLFLSFIFKLFVACVDPPLPSEPPCQPKIIYLKLCSVWKQKHRAVSLELQNTEAGWAEVWGKY